MRFRRSPPPRFASRTALAGDHAFFLAGLARKAPENFLLSFARFQQIFRVQHLALSCRRLVGNLCINRARMNCLGIDISERQSGRDFLRPFDHGVDPSALAKRRLRTYLAPGLIDFQVNGFAGVDYNSPHAAPEQIAHSIREMFRTGVTRFFPTVITGSPDDMHRALRNLAARRKRFRKAPAMELPSGRPVYLARRWTARRASRPLGAPAGSRRIPPLAGRRRRPHSHGDAWRPDWPRRRRFIEALVRRRRSGQHRPHQSQRPTDRGRGQRGRDALHAFRQRRPRRDAAPSELHLGPTGRGSPDRPTSSWMASTCRHLS